MSITFEDKVALVTGAASGLWSRNRKSFCRSEYFRVAGRLDEKELQATAEELTSEAHKTSAVHCDVSDDAQVEAMV